jgi:hypothetical protein
VVMCQGALSEWNGSSLSMSRFNLVEVLDNHVFYGVRTSQCVWGGEGGLLCRAVALSPIIGEVLDDWQEGMEAGKS